jgi:hypothetical protein
MTRGPAIALLALAGLAAVLLESCGQTPATPENRQETVEWAGHALREVSTLGALPPGLQAVLGVGNHGLDGIADRDGKYNPTDVVDSKLPMRRFLVAGLDHDAALIAIEHGGRGWRVDVSLYSNIGRTATVERTWTLFDSPRTLHALVDDLSRR